jgi:hypothetical protein
MHPTSKATQQLICALVFDLRHRRLEPKGQKKPLRIKTMNEYSAISPSRNDQWSGKDFAQEWTT